MWALWKQFFEISDYEELAGPYSCEVMLRIDQYSLFNGITLKTPKVPIS